MQTQRRPKSCPLSIEEDAFYSALVDDLKRRREQLALSQAALEHRLGVSEGLVAKWEAKHRMPGAFFLMCWCKSLDVRLKIEGAA